MKRKVCIITGSRAEYGLLKPLIDELNNYSNVKVQLVVTGMHLSPEFGYTYKEIENDNLKIEDRVEILLSSDSPIGISKSIGLGMISLAETFSRLKPDIIVGLGDRYELFSAVSAALIANIPVAHLHGGELTEGLIDDALRHSITKMSHLHFCSTDIYKKRIIQMGENPKRVFNYGAIGIDSIKNIDLLSKSDLEKSINFSINDQTFLVTYHPVTLEKQTSENQILELLSTLENLNNIKVIFTNPNSDTSGRIIMKQIEKFVSKNKGWATSFKSLGRLRYLSTLQYVKAVVGNSSSGIIEAPSFKIGSINIGDRQKGRIAAKSVINCEPNKEDISKAFVKLLTEKFQDDLIKVSNPYGNGGTAKKIARVIATHELSNIIKKKFHDINYD